MATLFSVYHKEGGLIGRCDARCYNAKGTRTRCVCGGVNHGVGLRQAASNSLTITHFFSPGLSTRLRLADIVVYRDPRLRQWARQCTLFDLHPNGDWDAAQEMLSKH